MRRGAAWRRPVHVTKKGGTAYGRGPRSRRLLTSRFRVRRTSGSTVPGLRYRAVPRRAAVNTAPRRHLNSNRCR